MPDELESLLALVAEGKLSPEEAAPLVSDLQRRTSAESDAEKARRAGREAARDARQAAYEARETAREARDRAYNSAHEALAGRRLKILVAEGGRSLVNLQMPLAAAGFAIDRIPGLSPNDRARIVDAIRRGMTGPIIEVIDDDDEVRIVIE